MRITKVTLTIRPDMTRTYEETFRRLRDHVLSEENGCRFFELCRDPDQPTKYHVFEAYDDEAALAFHISTPIYKETARIFVECIEGDHMTDIRTRRLNGRAMYDCVLGMMFERFESI